jgi:hypothetical protein
MYARTKQLPFVVQTPGKNHFSAYAQAHAASDAQKSAAVSISLYLYISMEIQTILPFIEPFLIVYCSGPNIRPMSPVL